MDVKNVKGTHDVYLEESDAYSAIESLMRSIAMVYGYKEIRTPVMEYTEVLLKQLLDLVYVNVSDATAMLILKMVKLSLSTFLMLQVFYLLLLS